MAFSAEWRPGEKGPQAGEPERPGLVLTADPLAGTLTPSGVPQEHPETPLGHSMLTKTLPHLPVPLTHARRCDPSRTLWQLAPVLPSLPTSPPLAGLLPGAQPPLGPPHTPPALCPALASRLELLLVPSPAAPPPCALPMGSAPAAGVCGPRRPCPAHLKGRREATWHPGPVAASPRDTGPPRGPRHVPGHGRPVRHAQGPCPSPAQASGQPRESEGS